MFTIDKEMLMFCLMGGIEAMDTEAVLQSMVFQPLVACSIAGLITGNLLLGWTVGVRLQLPFLLEVPIGGARVSLSNMGAYVASGLAIRLNTAFPGMPSYGSSGGLNLWH